MTLEQHDGPVQGGPVPQHRGALTGLRCWLRARPRLQGAVLAPAGLRRRLPDTGPALWLLLYHGVPQAYAPLLRRHLTALQRRGTFLDWDGAVALAARGAPTGPPRFCLSFDDGHKDWVDVLLPLLRELGLPATFFVTVDQVSAGPSRTRLSWADCRRLQQAGMRIGSHTLTHARLATLDTPRARREVVESKDAIEQQVGVPVLDFALPYGRPGSDFDVDRDLDLVREAGYRSCATTVTAPVVGPTDLLMLPRAGLSSGWPLAAVQTRLHA